MNMNQLTEKAQEAVIAAQTLAGEMTHAEITPEHLLVTLIEQQGGIVPSILRKLNVDPARASKDARGLLAAIPQVRGGDLRLSPRTQLVF
jgi:ATP-dependent Clp protease ATP-binding subunit ClpB